MIFVRAFARLIVLLVLLALALSGLATAIFAIGYDDSLVSLPKLAAYVQLPELREVVADWLDALEAGASDYCAAPFEPAQIRWVLQSHVRTFAAA